MMKRVVILLSLLTFLVSAESPAVAAVSFQESLQPMNAYFAFRQTPEWGFQKADLFMKGMMSFYDRIHDIGIAAKSESVIRDPALKSFKSPVDSTCLLPKEVKRIKVKDIPGGCVLEFDEGKKSARYEARFFDEFRPKMGASYVQVLYQLQFLRGDGLNLNSAAEAVVRLRKQFVPIGIQKI